MDTIDVSIRAASNINRPLDDVVWKSNLEIIGCWVVPANFFEKHYSNALLLSFEGGGIQIKSNTSPN